MSAVIKELATADGLAVPMAAAMVINSAVMLVLGMVV